LHLQFAYYESSLVVEFLVQQFGIEKLRAVLRDLGQGTEINAAIAKNTEAMEKLEEGFAAFAKERAMNLAPGLDFEKPEFQKKQVASRSMRAPRKRRSENRILGLDPTNEVVSAEATNRISPTKSETNSPARPEVAVPHPVPETFEEWVKSNPTNFWAMSAQAGTLTEAKKWTEAKPLLERLIELFPNSIGPDSAYPLLATTYRALGDTNSERKVLAQFAAKDDEAPEAYLRLMEIASVAGNWEEVRENAQRFLAVNPLIATPHRYLLEASEHSRDDRGAIKACKALLELDPPDPAGTHFQMAKLLHRVGDPAARRHVLQALEEAPRYRDALDLLVQINNSAPSDNTPKQRTVEPIH
jgi:tetratricopeptide (TPR) repeat protein